jgi:hypothetical protein
MTTVTPSPDPPPEEIAAGLAALQEYVNHNAPAAQPSPPMVEPEDTSPAEPELDEEPEEEPDFDEEEGETKRVRQLRAEVAEAYRILELQEHDAPLLIETKKVRKRRRAVSEAARLHELSQDPVAMAYRDAKVRRTVTAMVMTAAANGLAASSIGVQASVAKALDLQEGTLPYYAAYLTEPALSLPLLAAVAVQAYSAMRGQVVDRKDKTGPGRKLFRAEALLLTLTLILNCWPAFAPGVDFSLLTLLVHSLGPVAAVTAVWVLPALWSVLAVLPVPKIASTGGTRPSYRGGTPRRYTPAKVDIEALADRAKALIDGGELPADAGVHKIRKALGCGVEPARLVKQALTEGDN